MKFVCPLLVVSDLAKSRFLYEELLGQRVKSDFGENVTYHGDFSIHQKEHYESLIKTEVTLKPSHSFELYFEDDDLEVIEKRILEHELAVLHRVEEQPWRQKVLRFYDYDMHLIEVGETMEHVAYRLSLEGLSLAEISRITYLDQSLVKESIHKFSN